MEEIKLISYSQNLKLLNGYFSAISISVVKLNSTITSKSIEVNLRHQKII